MRHWLVCTKLPPSISQTRGKSTAEPCLGLGLASDQRRAQLVLGWVPSADGHAMAWFYYAPQLYRQVLLRRVLAMAILSVCLSVRHNLVPNQAQVR